MIAARSSQHVAARSCQHVAARSSQHVAARSSQHVAARSQRIATPSQHTAARSQRTAARSQCLASLAFAAMLAACAPTPLRTSLPSTWRASPNFDDRRPNVVVIHYTGDRSADASLRTLTSPLHRVSAHYLVARDGGIVQLVDERARAWHAGRSRWGANTDLNSSSIGIELDNDGSEPFAATQLDALLRLLRDVVERHDIPPANVVGHADVAPRRKLDPGRRFPWDVLARHGFGLWCDPPYPAPPEGFDPLAGLRIVGYDTTDPAAAIKAFKAHFLPQDATTGLDAQAGALAHCLAQAALAREAPSSAQPDEAGPDDAQRDGAWPDGPSAGAAH